MSDKKKTKKPKRYVLTFTSDCPTDKMRHLHFSPLGVGIMVGIVVLLIVLTISYNLGMTLGVQQATAEIKILTEKVNKTEESRKELQAQNEDLNSMITLLSDTVNQKLEAEKQLEEEEIQKRTPRGLPLNGTANIYEPTEEELLAMEAIVLVEGGLSERQTYEQQLIVIFTAVAGTDIISSGKGVVEVVEPDSVYGNVVKIDHGNGYRSIYRCPATPKVQVGQEIERGVTLYELETNEQKLGYQATKEDQIINPLELLEISG